MTRRELFTNFSVSLNRIYEKKEAESLALLCLKHVSQLDSLQFHIHYDKEIEQTEIDWAQNILNRLLNYEPFQYIVEETWFYGLRFNVNQNVLIPRPETEVLVDLIIKENIKLENLTIIDIGTGSGCIAVSLAHSLKNANILAIDNSENALNIAKQNAEINNCNVTFYHLDIFQNNLNNIINDVDIIVSNPPYVFESDKKFMQANVLQYEPHEALFVPDENALMFYEAIVNQAQFILKKNGKLYFEIHEKTGFKIERLLKTYNFSDINLIEDFNKKHRFVSAIKNN